MRRRNTLIVIGAAVLVLIAGGAFWFTAAPHPTSPAIAAAPGRPGQAGSSSTPAPFTSLSTAQIAVLPEARYNAVIPALIAYSSPTSKAASYTTYSTRVDTPIYGSDHSRPVARFAAKNFMALPTVIVAVKSDGPWTLVLTPARQGLPSEHHDDAPAQTVGWVRTSSLTKMAALDKRVVVSASAQTLTIQTTAGVVLSTYRIGVGTRKTPSPTGVTGYIEAKYLDATQGEPKYPIQLTSLHSTVADNPYGGKDGGLIALHWGIVGDGVVSHGCLRLTPAAITAVNLLPLGTSVSIVK
jgi:hypothetical protein